MKVLKFVSQRVIYLLLLSIIAIFAFILANLSTTVEVLCKQMVHKSLVSVNFELDNYFNPIKEDLIVTVEAHQNRAFYPNDFKDFNQEFEALIANKPHVSSILLATSEGDEYMILDADSCWVTRSTFKGSLDSLPSKYFWSKRTEKEVYHHIKYDNAYDPRERPWYKNAISQPLKSLHWTEPYTFFTTKEPGITISTAWQNKDEDRKMVTAFDVLLSNISDFTSTMEISDNGFVFVLTNDGKVIGLPANNGFETKKEFLPNLLKPYKDLGIDPINQAMAVYHDGLETDTSFRFEANNEHWWGDVEEYKIGENENEQFIVGVVVPESDFVGTVIESRNFIIIGFIVIFIITIFLIKVYRDKHKSNNQLKEQQAEIMQKNSMLKSANQEITEAKMEIEEKSNEILDSINYAKRIQTAILPPPSYWAKNLPESFVLYIPKDIVAGDFYWMDVIDNEVLFAAADCTGHGVPGAMVSVVCHNALNRVVHEFGMHQPAEILDEVTDLVIETFERADHEVKDGMDISLCGLTLDTMQLEFAGAHNPLWLIRDGNAAYEGMKLSLELNGKSLYEIKADKQPVGKFEHRTPFTYNKIQVQKGDTIYLSSDGFPDQFGGDKGKKLKTKAFKKLLIELCDHDIKDQKEMLRKAFFEWKGEFEQLDDVCVIGVKV